MNLDNSLYTVTTHLSSPRVWSVGRDLVWEIVQVVGYSSTFMVDRGDIGDDMWELGNR